MIPVVASERPKRSKSHSARSDCTTKPPAKASRLKSAARVKTTRRDRRAGDLGGEAAVEEQGGQPEPGVEQEGSLERRLGPAGEEVTQHLREAGAQRSDRAGERA